MCPEYTVILKGPSPNSGWLHYGHQAPQTSWCPAGEWAFTTTSFVYSPASLHQYLQCVVPVGLDSCRMCFFQGSPEVARFSLTLVSLKIHFLQLSTLAMEQLSLTLGACRVMALSCTVLLQGRLPPAPNSSSVHSPLPFLGTFPWYPRGQIFSKSHWWDSLATSWPSREPWVCSYPWGLDLLDFSPGEKGTSVGILFQF